MPSCHTAPPYHTPDRAAPQQPGSQVALCLHSATRHRRGAEISRRLPPPSLLLCSSLAGCARVSSRDVLEVLKVLLQQLVHRGDVVLELGEHLLEVEQPLLDARARVEPLLEDERDVVVG